MQNFVFFVSFAVLLVHNKLMGTSKRDIFYDTKAGRTFLSVLAVLLIAGGLLIIFKSLLLKDWSWIFFAACGIVSGVCNLIICNRRKKSSGN